MDEIAVFFSPGVVIGVQFQRYCLFFGALSAQILALWMIINFMAWKPISIGKHFDKSATPFGKIQGECEFFLSS